MLLLSLLGLIARCLFRRRQGRTAFSRRNQILVRRMIEYGDNISGDAQFSVFLKDSLAGDCRIRQNRNNPELPRIRLKNQTIDINLIVESYGVAPRCNSVRVGVPSTIRIEVLGSNCSNYRMQDCYANVERVFIAEHVGQPKIQLPAYLLAVTAERGPFRPLPALDFR